MEIAELVEDSPRSVSPASTPDVGVPWTDGLRSFAGTVWDVPQESSIVD